MPANHNEIEKKLWASADELRANSHLKSSEYSVPVLGLIFLRFADQRFGQVERELTATVHVGSRRTIGKADYKAPGSEISEDLGGVEQLLDISVATKDYLIREPSVAYETQTLIDLNKIDFDALQAQFNTKHKHIEFEKLRGAVESKLKRMVQLNKSRVDYYERFQRLIDDYNADSENVDLHLHQLIAFTSTLNQEDQRHISEQLSEEELAMFDLLTRPNMALSEQEKAEVKKVARTLLETLKREKLVLDWRKKQQAKADVQVTIDQILDSLPPSYTQEIYLQLCTEVFQHVYESYFGQGKSVYAVAS